MYYPKHAPAHTHTHTHIYFSLTHTHALMPCQTQTAHETLAWIGSIQTYYIKFCGNTAWVPTHTDLKI
jgi:hypothetical protein